MASPVQSLTPRSAVLLTKSDTTIYDAGNGGPIAGIYVGGTGDLNVVTQNGETTLFSAVPVGTIIPITCTQVKATSTTATLIVGLRY